MTFSKRSFLPAIGLSLMLVLPAQAALKSPDQVKTCLRLMMQVTNDFGRQIARKTFARLPHENLEFHDATGALRQAIAGEPADFKAKVDPLIQKAIDAAQKTSDDNTSNDAAKLTSDHAAMLQSVNMVFAQFPEDMRPDPNVQPGGAAGGGR